MTDSEWAAWSGRHAAIFSMTRPIDVQMFVQWRVEFRAMGFTAAELHAATDHLSREAKDVTRWDHLTAIRDRIREQRRAGAAAKRQQPLSGKPDRGACDLCNESGWAGGLPHLSQITADGWLPLIDDRPAMTQAAVCLCLVGRWKLDGWDQSSAEFKEKHKRPMTLDGYTRLNPEWRAQVRELAERRKLKTLSNIAARDADASSIGKTIRSLMGKLRHGAA